MAEPSLKVVVRLARNRQTLTDHVVLGLVTGGLLGPGVLVEGRESNGVRFRKIGGWLSSVPDRGEILISTDVGGETQVECRVWCWTLLAQRLLAACGLGLLAAGLALFLGSRATAIVAGLLVAVTFHLTAWSFARWRLRRQIETYLHNTTYLRAF